MKIVVTGGTGFIGSHLVQQLRKSGHEVRVLSRRAQPDKGIYSWDFQKGQIDENVLKDIDGIIHLAGASIAKKWTKSYKSELYASRVESLKFLEGKLLESGQNLQFLISASGVNYYGTETTLHTYTEEDPAGTDYLAKLCVDWEYAALDFKVPTEQKSILRTSVVLDKNGGALTKMLPSFKWGMGAVLGRGDQVMPMISLSDLVNLYQYLLDQQLDGIYNAVAFNLTQKEFAKELAQKLNRPLWMKVPSLVLKTMMGEMSSILLEGSAVSNEKMKSKGFEFQQDTFQKFKL